MKEAFRVSKSRIIQARGYKYEGDLYPIVPEEGLFLPASAMPPWRDLELDAQVVLVRKFPERWRHGSFDKAFRELNVITEAYQEVSLETAEKIVRSEMERSKEAFEAFGVKFPIESTARWGILLLVGIQMYFWLHLTEYRRRKIMDPPVAWIGSYSAIFPRIVFSVSTLALPVFVVSFVAIRGNLITTPKGLKWVSVGGIALISCILAVLTAVEYFAVRRTSKDA